MAIILTTWGHREFLRNLEHWSICLLTITPGQKFEGGECEHARIFQVVDGQCYITQSDGRTRVIRSGGSFVPPNHTVEIDNPFDGPVMLIETMVLGVEAIGVDAIHVRPDNQSVH